MHTVTQLAILYISLFGLHTQGHEWTAWTSFWKREASVTLIVRRLLRIDMEKSCDSSLGARENTKCHSATKYI